MLNISVFKVWLLSLQPVALLNPSILTTSLLFPGCAALQQRGKVQAPPVPQILPASVQSGAPAGSDNTWLESRAL